MKLHAENAIAGDAGAMRNGGGPDHIPRIIVNEAADPAWVEKFGGPAQALRRRQNAGALRREAANAAAGRRGSGADSDDDDIGWSPPVATAGSSEAGVALTGGAGAAVLPAGQSRQVKS